MIMQFHNFCNKFRSSVLLFLKHGHFIATFLLVIFIDLYNILHFVFFFFIGIL